MVVIAMGLMEWNARRQAAAMTRELMLPLARSPRLITAPGMPTVLRWPATAGIGGAGAGGCVALHGL
ncbi:hypothetical protein D7Y53_22690 [Stenotrophomonas maltophilia]|nr:hypothetical protein [Stenotrophomonas maltophilia]MBA0323418.1 hypothetical protein [Stenotrophomonas maltophilia]MBA0432718.1 hypothetical protein [Stenotrophomonas maltophilia]